MNHEQIIIRSINLLITSQEAGLVKIKKLMESTQKETRDYDRLYTECLDLQKSASILRHHVVNLTQIHHTKLEVEARS